MVPVKIQLKNNKIIWTCVGFKTDNMFRIKLLLQKGVSMRGIVCVVLYILDGHYIKHTSTAVFTLTLLVSALYENNTPM